MKYKLPKHLIKKFVEVSSKNYAHNNPIHVETLALMIGQKSRSAISVTNLVFPDQECHSDHVIDKGKHSMTP